MCGSNINGPTGAGRKPRGGLFGAVIKDFVQAKNPTFNPVKRTIDNWSPNAPANPMGVAMAGMASAKAGVTPLQAKPMRIADSFLGTTDQPAQKPESGYKVVG